MYNSQLPLTQACSGQGSRRRKIQLTVRYPTMHLQSSRTVYIHIRVPKKLTRRNFALKTLLNKIKNCSQREKEWTILWITYLICFKLASFCFNTASNASENSRPGAPADNRSHPRCNDYVQSLQIFAVLCTGPGLQNLSNAVIHTVEICEYGGHSADVMKSGK